MAQCRICLKEYDQSERRDYFCSDECGVEAMMIGFRHAWDKAFGTEAEA